MKKIDSNTVLTYAAILLSTISAFGVIWQTKVASDQREAAVWPYVQVFPGRNSVNPTFSISVTNVGVGPALMRYFSVSVDNKPVQSWREFLAAISEEEVVREAYFDESVSQGSGWVLPPNTPLLAFATNSRDAVSVLDPPSWARIDIKFCYCSVFDSCWQSSWAVSKTEEDPTPVRSCPVQDQFGIPLTELVPSVQLDKPQSAEGP